MRRLFGRGPCDGRGRVAGPWPRDPSLGALPASCDVPEDCRFGTDCAGACFRIVMFGFLLVWGMGIGVSYQ